MRIAVISNINMDLLSKKLSCKYEVYKQDGYGTWINTLFEENSKLYEFCPDVVFLLLDGEELFRNQDNLEQIEKQIHDYMSYIETSILKNKNVTYFVSNLDIPLNKIRALKDISNERYIENYWTNNLYKINEKYDNFYIFDIKNIVENIGRDNFYSMKSWYLAGMKTSMKALDRIEKEISKITLAIKGNRKKCLILDMDNTLWGGIVGENGYEGIELSEFKEGARYKDFQKRIKEMKELGVILAISSKNNDNDALQVLRDHDHMVLKEEDFTSLKINWNLKSDNIREIAKELNIALDSMVFIDDNPFEQEAIKEQIPEVTVPEFPKDTSSLNQFIQDIYNNYFFILKATEEDKIKTKIYKEKFQRDSAQKKASSFADYLKSLNTKVTIWKACERDISRISQLTQKTNQFNLTTKRYTESDIYNYIISDRHEVYVASVEDKFGDNGKVVVAIVEKKQHSIAEIDTFLMSCRVIGRCIEDSIISFIEYSLYEEGFKGIVGYYYPTDKNKLVEGLYEKLGYEILAKDEKNNKKYYKELQSMDSNQNEKYVELIVI